MYDSLWSTLPLIGQSNMQKICFEQCVVHSFVNLFFSHVSGVGGTWGGGGSSCWFGHLTRYFHHLLCLYSKGGKSEESGIVFCLIVDFSLLFCLSWLSQRATHHLLAVVPARLWIGETPRFGGLLHLDVFSFDFLVVPEALFRDLHPIDAADIRLEESEQFRHVASSREVTIVQIERYSWDPWWYNALIPSSVSSRRLSEV